MPSTVISNGNTNPILKELTLLGVKGQRTIKTVMYTVLGMLSVVEKISRIYI